MMDLMSSVKHSRSLIVPLVGKTRYLFLLFCCLSICRVQAQVFEQVIGYSNGIINRPVASFGDNGVYVIDEQAHRVIGYTSGGQVAVSIGGYGTEDGKFRTPSGIAVANSKIYVVDSGNHRVQVFSASSGSFLYAFGSEGSGDGQFNTPKGIFVDSYNQVIVVDQGNARIQLFNSNGTFIRKFGTYGSGNGQLNNPVGVFSADVSFQLRIYVADAGNNRVQYFDYNGAYLGQFGTAGTGDGQFNNPTSIRTVTTSSGVMQFFVADSGNKRIQAFSTAGAFLGIVGSAGTGDGQFNAISDLATVTYGFRACDPVNGTISTFLGGGTGLPTFSSKFSQNTTANGRLYYPQNMARLNSFLYAADKKNKRIQIFNVTFGNAYESKFGEGYAVEGIAVDESNKVYATNPVDNKIRVYNSIGGFQYEIGASGSGPGQLNTPGDLVVVKSGSDNLLYVLDRGNYRVQVFNAATGIPVRNFGTQGTGNGQFTTPNGIGADASGKIYVAEDYRIQVFDGNGNWLKTITGAGQGSGNGQFDRIQDVAVDASGNIYVVENSNNRIQLLTSEGVFIRKFGTFGFGDGEFNNPSGIFLYENQIYVADQMNHRLQVLQAKSAPQINFSNFTHTFGEAPFALNATSNSTGAITYSVVVGGTGSVTLNGNTVTLTQAGDVFLRASVAEDANYKAAYKDVQLTINKGTAQLTLSDLQHYYDNTPKYATVTTSPAGLQGVSVSYVKDGVYSSYAQAIGQYNVVATLNNTNYTAPTASDVLTVSGKLTPVINNFNDFSKTYGEGPFTLNATTNSTGAITYSEESGGTGDVTLSGNTVTIVKAGSVFLKASVAESANHVATSKTIVLTINKAAAGITLGSLTHVYDGAAKSATYITTPSGKAVAIEYRQGGTLIANPVNAGSYDVTATVSDDNYQGTTTGMLIVSKGTAAVNLSSLTHTYDGSVKYATYSTTPSGKTVVIEYRQNGTLISYPANAGSYDVTATVTDNNYQGSATGTLVINKATATISIGNLTHTYNGTVKAATATTTPAGRTVSFEYRQGGVSATPTKAGQYNITATVNDANYQGTATALLTINKAPLTIKADDVSRKYGVANPASYSFTFTGLVNGENALAALTTFPSAATTATVTSNAGTTYPITSSGAASDNYALTYQNGTLTITQADATLSLSNLSHTYDGQAKAATVSTEPAGLSGVSITYKQGASTVTPVNVGTYTVEARLSNINYAAPMVTGTLTISNKPVASITNFGNLTKTYGDVPFNLNASANSTGAITYSAFSVTGEVTISNNTVTILKAGTVTLQVNVAEDANYAAASLQATLEIGKAPLTVTAHNKTRLYGENNPPLTWSFSGFKNGDDNSVIDSQPYTLLDAIASSPAGNYPIKLAGASDNNYQISYADGTLTVAKAPLTITAENKTRTYGDSNPAFTFTYEGFRLNDSKADLTALPVATTTATVESDAGSYAIQSAGAAALNYQITYVSGTLTVTQAPLSVKVADASRKYGDANPVFLLTYEGFRNGDVVEDLKVKPDVSTEVDERSDVGTYPIVLSGGSDPNYDFVSYSNGILTIEKADQHIIFPAIGSKNVNDKDFEIGASASSGLAITYTVAGPAVLVEGNKISLTGKAGTVTVKASQAGDQNHKAAADVIRTFAVNEKLSQVITFATFAQRTFDQGNVVLNASASSNLGVSFTSSDNTVATIDGNVVVVKKPGTVVITASQEGNDIYNAAPQVNRTLVIAKGVQQIVFDALMEKTLGEESFRLDAKTSSGLPVSYTSSNTAVATINGDVVTIVGEGEAIITAAQTGNDVYASAEAVNQKLVVRLITEAEFTPDRSASAYPNPATDLLVVETKVAASGSVVRVTDLHGRNMNVTVREADAFTHNIDVSSLPSGVYVVQVNLGARVITTQRIVKR
ncbi:6-bladed beta-propeller [Fulvivirgaceae bacterium PWU4]|uniref:6-bladed beta-propeller n=1 Tax=Chryseosolibacter histidini TaxID=2782349 RepID=A0AAP2GN33_9BACT|nr:MBG domain-containing protein [Chryseosolibacter histidini]MBT1697598.1 6-bladed beta-propeller [Chryseosolibacter histidini]